MNITIRRADPEDWQAVRKIYNGSNAIRWTLQLPFVSADMWRKRLEQQEGAIHLVACADDEIVGNLGLITFGHKPRRRHVGKLGMAVRDDWQGKGVGTALMEAAINLADRWLNLERLELEVYSDNEPAVHLYQKFSFEVEGTLRRYAFRDGEYGRLCHGPPATRLNGVRRIFWAL